MCIARHLFAILLLLALASACASGGRNPASGPPFYPNAGFGRAGCYAGPSLQRRCDGEVIPPDSAAARGPWLVFDSLTTAELVQAGFRKADVTREELRFAALLERRDSVEWTGGTWHRTPPDSLVFQEKSTFPSVQWRFQVMQGGLRGEGILVHDMVIHSPDGTSRRPVSRWPVHLVQVSCEDVPVRQP